MNELDKFFDALPEEDKGMDLEEAFGIKKNQSEEVTKETDTVPVEEDANDEESEDVETQDEKIPFGKNPKIQKYIERQVRKQLEEKGSSKVETVQPVQQAKQEVSDELPAEWIMAYGDGEQSRMAYKYHQKSLEEAALRGKEEALKELRFESERQLELEKQHENFITNSLESIEDYYGVDLTSDTPSARKTRSEFLELVGKISPKDKDGNIVEYADFNSTWSIFDSIHSKKEESKQSSYKKSLADRSMVKSKDVKVIDPKSPKTPISFGQRFFG